MSPLVYTLLVSTLLVGYSSARSDCPQVCEIYQTSETRPGVTTRTPTTLSVKERKKQTQELLYYRTHTNSSTKTGTPEPEYQFFDIALSLVNPDARERLQSKYHGTKIKDVDWSTVLQQETVGSPMYFFAIFYVSNELKSYVDTCEDSDPGDLYNLWLLAYTVYERLKEEARLLSFPGENAKEIQGNGREDAFVFVWQNVMDNVRDLFNNLCNNVCHRKYFIAQSPLADSNYFRLDKKAVYR